MEGNSGEGRGRTAGRGLGPISDAVGGLVGRNEGRGRGGGGEAETLRQEEEEDAEKRHQLRLGRIRRACPCGPLLSFNRAPTSLWGFCRQRSLRGRTGLLWYPGPGPGLCCSLQTRTRWNAWWDSVALVLEQAMDSIIHTLGPCYIIIALTLILSVLYIYFSLLLPTAFGTRPLWMGALHAAVSLWLTFCILFNYALCIYTDPGFPPHEPLLEEHVAKHPESGLLFEHADMPTPQQQQQQKKEYQEQEQDGAEGTQQQQQEVEEGEEEEEQQQQQQRLQHLGLQQHQRRRRQAQEGFRPSAVEKGQASSHAPCPGGNADADLEAGNRLARDLRTNQEEDKDKDKGEGGFLAPSPHFSAAVGPRDPPATITSTFKWCKLCKRRKSAFTHHCYVCKRCVLRMDHHCPWMNSCVGFRNYRYFFCFLLYLWLGCLYALHLSWQLLIVQGQTEPGVVFTLILSVAVLMALSLLFLWHIYLVGTAQTTIDFYGFRLKRLEAKRAGRVWRNEFDLGFCANFVVTLQLCPPLWGLGLLVPQVVRMQGDGMSFLTAHNQHQPP